MVKNINLLFFDDGLDGSDCYFDDVYDLNKSYIELSSELTEVEEGFMKGYLAA